MKKVMTGLAAVTLLTAACGGLNEVEPEQNADTAGQANEENEPQTEENSANATENNTGTENNAVENTEETDTENETNAEDESNNEQTAANNVEDVVEFDLQIEFSDDTEWEYELERNDLEDMEVDRDGEESLSGEAAMEEIEALLSELTIDTERTLEEMIQEVLEASGAPMDEVEDVDMEIKYADGEEIVIDHEGRQQSADLGTVKEFDLDIDFVNGEDLEYDYDANDPEGEIERRDDSETEGAEAIEEIESLLSEINITMDRSISEMKQEVLNALDIDGDEVLDFDIDAEYENGQSIKFKHDVE